ncbi:hypothetical protein ACWNYI_00565 [Candidatus Vidania fulgoroideorum]
MKIKTLNNYIIVKEVKLKQNNFLLNLNKKLGKVLYINKKNSVKYKIKKGYFLFFKKFLNFNLYKKKYLFIKIKDVIFYFNEN